MALTDAMLKVLVREGVEFDCFSVVPLKNHFQVGAGLAVAVHVNVTLVFSETSNDDVVGPVSTGTAAQKSTRNIRMLKTGISRFLTVPSIIISLLGLVRDQPSFMQICPDIRNLMW